LKSNALQEMIKKIFSDETTRAKFESNPESVISEYPLTEQEKKAVLSIDAKMGLITSNSPQLEAALEGESGWLSPTTP
jgi:hypothetical protein